MDRTKGRLVKIDPRTDKTLQLSAPGVLGVTAQGGYLWLIVPSKRSHHVLGYTTK